MKTIWIVEATDSVTRQLFRDIPFDKKKDAIAAAEAWREDGSVQVSIRKMRVTGEGLLVEG